MPTPRGEGSPQTRGVARALALRPGRADLAGPAGCQDHPKAGSILSARPTPWALAARWQRVLESSPARQQTESRRPRQCRHRWQYAHRSSLLDGPARPPDSSCRCRPHRSARRPDRDPWPPRARRRAECAAPRTGQTAVSGRVGWPAPAKPPVPPGWPGRDRPPILSAAVRRNGGLRERLRRRHHSSPSAAAAHGGHSRRAAPGGIAQPPTVPHPHGPRRPRRSAPVRRA